MVKYNVIPNIASTSYTNSGFNNVRKAPLYFVRSGYVSGNTGSLSNNYGKYYSSTVLSVNSQRLSFDSTLLNPAERTYWRYYGYSLRCIVR